MTTTTNDLDVYVWPDGYTYTSLPPGDNGRVQPDRLLGPASGYSATGNLSAHCCSRFISL